MKKKKIHIVSLGCPKNMVDAEVMSAELAEGGFAITPREQDAELILVNTCAFILPAKEESIAEIFRLAEWKKKGSCRYLIVTGCLPQRYGDSLEREIPEVDLFLGTGEVGRVAEHIKKLQSQAGEDRFIAGEPDFLMSSDHPRKISTPFYTAYLKIAEGCSNHCSYCIIPSVRGKYRSRQPDDILREAQALAARGLSEAILVAQDTSAYGRDLKSRPGLAALMRDIASIDGIRWIRLLYVHPASLTAGILETIAAEKKICPYIDIPIQHIDDGLLKAMNRKGGSDLIREKIGLARSIVPGVVLRTSLITGFPGESRGIQKAARFYPPDAV